MIGLRRQRKYRQNDPVNDSDDDEKKSHIPDRQEKLPVSSKKRKVLKRMVPKKNEGNTGGQKKDPCPKHTGGLGSVASNTVDEVSRGPDGFQVKIFLNLINQSTFPQKNDHGKEEDNENDDESSVSDPEKCPIEDFEEDESAYSQEFFPLVTQYSPSFSISSQPSVQCKKQDPLSPHWKTFSRGTGSTLEREVRASKSSSVIQSNDTDPNLISKHTATFYRASSTRITYEATDAVDLAVMNDSVVEPLLTLLPRHEYKPKEQFYNEDRELLEKIPLSVVYKDENFTESIISLDDFGDSTNALFVRAHYSSPNLGTEYSIDLFNNAAILSAKHFVSPFMMTLNLEFILNVQHQI